MENLHLIWKLQVQLDEISGNSPFYELYPLLKAANLTSLVGENPLI